MWSRKNLANRHRFWEYVLYFLPSTSHTEILSFLKSKRKKKAKQCKSISFLTFNNQGENTLLLFIISTTALYSFLMQIFYIFQWERRGIRTRKFNLFDKIEYLPQYYMNIFKILFEFYKKKSSEFEKTLSKIKKILFVVFLKIPTVFKYVKELEKSFKWIFCSIKN